MNNGKEIIGLARYSGADICQGCGGYTPDGERTGNLNFKHFLLSHGNSGHVITYCKECAEKIALFMLHAWDGE